MFYDLPRYFQHELLNRFGGSLESSDTAVCHGMHGMCVYMYVWLGHLEKQKERNRIKFLERIDENTDKEDSRAMDY